MMVMSGMHLSLELSQRTPGFSGIPSYRHRGKKSASAPGKIALIAPHANELVHPFRSALSEKLFQEGLRVVEETIPDIMARGWLLRAAVGDAYASYSGRQVVTAVLSVEDYLVRLRLLESLLADPSLLAVELHAYNARSDSELFEEPREFRRLPRTRILIRFQSLDKEVGEVLAMLYSLHLQTWVAVDIAAKRGFDLYDAVAELEERMHVLKAQRKRILVLELPSQRVPIDSSHPAYHMYFTDDGYPQEWLSNFEADYCATFGMRMKFTELDVERVKRLIVPGPSRN
jgi:hypothetical protein